MMKGLIGVRNGCCLTITRVLPYRGHSRVLSGRQGMIGQARGLLKRGLQSMRAVQTIRCRTDAWVFGPAAVAGVISVLLPGCAGQIPPPTSSIQAGLGCVDDSLECRNKRQAALGVLLADKSRAWVRQPADAAAYASGVRLFAYKKRKRELSCAELSIGHREAKAARPTLRAAAGTLTPGQIARGAMLGDEVGGELARERRKRKCKA